MLFINDTPKGSTYTALLFMVPACKCQAVLDLCHWDVGHQGRDRTYSLLQERFWWPKMRMQMMMALQKCEKCKIYEKKDPKAPLCTVATTEPMDLIHVDLVGMEVTIETKKKPVVQKILVVTDHFSRFIQAYMVKDKRAITIAKCLYDNYFRHYDSSPASIVWPGNRVLQCCIEWNVHLLEHQETPYITIPPTDKWCSRVCSPDTGENDCQARQQMM